MNRKRRCRFRAGLAVIMGLAAAGAAPERGSAQAVQATMSFKQAGRDGAATERQAIARRLESYAEELRDLDGSGARRRQLDEVVGAGFAVLRGHPGDRTYPALVSRFLEAESRLSGGGDAIGPPAHATTPAPQIGVLIPDVVFTVGDAYTVGSGHPAVNSVGVSTNLLGALTGSAFDALGSEGLRNYFVRNVSAGTSIPTGRGGRLTAELGLGLGGIDLGNARLWPVLAVEQLDSRDRRVPGSIVAARPDEGSWSSPVLAVAIVPRIDRFTRRVQARKLAPVFTVGLRLPYFYPGNAFAALGALFSDKRKDFERESGGTSVTLQISAPLLPERGQDQE